MFRMLSGSTAVEVFAVGVLTALARSLSEGLVDPNAVYPGIAAVAHDPLGGLRSRDDHHAVNATRY